MDLKETKVSSEPIYEGSFVSISRDTVRLANGNESKRIVIRHPGAASVLAETENGEIVVRPMMYLALSYDHRIIDGREAVLTLVTIKELLEDPARLVLDI